MGTNFYLIKTDEHVGKRSAAGSYCWDCGVTLCRDGESGIHAGESSWYSKCPKCGKLPIKESFVNSSSGRELGLNIAPFEKKTGVSSCSSFTWAIEKEKIFFKYRLLRIEGKEIKVGKKKVNKKKIIMDEYGRKFSLREFESILSECPIQYFGSIGREFS